MDFEQTGHEYLQYQILMRTHLVLEQKKEKKKTKDISNNPSRC